MAPSTMAPPSDHGLSSTSLSVVGGRRKTPSELRHEQLKRNFRVRTTQDGEPALIHSQGSMSEQKKVPPRLVDTRVADIFAATKPHDRPKFPFMKQKDDLEQAFPNCRTEASTLNRKVDEEEARLPATGDAAKVVLSTSEKVLEAGCGSQTEDCHVFSKFRNITQIASSVKPPTLGSTLDMAEALRVMAPIGGRDFGGPTMGPPNRMKLLPSGLLAADSIRKSETLPLDLSLKLTARFLSADSLHWCHRTKSANDVEGLNCFIQNAQAIDQADHCSESELLDEQEILKKFGASFCQSLYSWVHPPPEILELYNARLTSARGDARKDTLLTTLQRIWEDSFSSLYYMFLHRRCNLFYVCNQQSVVMFVGGDICGKSKDSSSAYWTRSTRGLRKLLQDQGVEFFMPFCNSEADKATLEELLELTEFEKANPGQTRLIDSSTTIDNSPQSLLAFTARSVHRLFDFLLNYRCLVGSTNAMEFPVLYSPVAFNRATLHVPEVKCKHMEYSTSTNGQSNGEPKGMLNSESAINMMYSLELKGPMGSYIPPWTIRAVCSVLQKSQKTGFDGSFVTGPLSETCNAAQVDVLDTVNSSAEKASEVSRTDSTSADVSICKLKIVKQLKFSQGVYQTSPNPSL